LGRALPGLRTRDIPVLQACLADAGRCRRRHDGNFHETEGQAGAVRRDAVVLRLALQGGGDHCWDMLRRRRIRQDKETDDLENVPLEHPDPSQLELLIEQRTSAEVRKALDKLGGERAWRW